MSGRRWLVPEVVQSSALDCGPAALHAMLRGYRIASHYVRLRELCRTSVNGTSIDAIEAVANRLGLDAEQIVIPEDHLFCEGSTLPAVLIVRNASGATHFVVVWRDHGRRVQLMDPASGRRFPSKTSLIRDTYRHEMSVSAAEWRRWAATEEFLGPLRARLAALDVPVRTIERWVRRANRDAGWRTVAELDAATRFVTSAVRSKGVRRGKEARGVVEGIVFGDGPGSRRVPDRFRHVREDADRPGFLRMRGIVLVRVHGRSRTEPERTIENARVGESDDGSEAPLRELRRFETPELRALVRPVVVIAALSAAGVAFEGLLFRTLLDLRHDLHTPWLWAGAGAGMFGYSLAMLLLELPLAQASLLLGRQLETRLRQTVRAKLTRIDHRYFQTRLVSDMAERAHRIVRLRSLPTTAIYSLRIAFAMVATTAAIVWLDPAGAGWALAALAVSLFVPWATRPLLAEAMLRSRAHAGALGRFFLDALLGGAAVKAHAAEKPIRRQHESMAVAWGRARLAFEARYLAVHAATFGIGLLLVTALLVMHGTRTGESGSQATLLLFYWAYQIPILGQRLVESFKELADYGSVARRLVEPLQATDEPGAAATANEGPRSAGVEIELDGVSVRAGGTDILRDLALTIPAGSRVALVGRSGGGKSTLVRLLVGLQSPSRGAVHVDGLPLTGEHLRRIRRDTVWVDPDIQLWNRSLAANLQYGNASAIDPVGALRDACLDDLLVQFPDGLRTRLGENGNRLSGGEAQRVRFARGLGRGSPRLVLLDEPFRGVDDATARRLLEHALERFSGSTLLFVTHSMAHLHRFDRVVVIEDGTILEWVGPDAIDRPESHLYRYAAHDRRLESLWSDRCWSRLRPSTAAEPR